MKITPIIPTAPAKDRKQRAVMVIHHEQHIVVTDTGERHTLPAMEAWQLYDKLNIIV